MSKYGAFIGRSLPSSSAYLRSQCDETKPRCVSCLTADLQCQYLSKQPTRLSPTFTGPHVNDLSNTLNASTSSGDGMDSELRAPSLHPVQQQTIPHSDLVNMELLHHWSTVTYATMSPESDQQEMWQTTTVRIGLSHPFLLNEILAIAAMHLAICRPERQDFYHTRATELQSFALNEFNSVQKQVSESNCVAILLFSSLLGVHLLADREGTRSLGSSEYLDHIQRYISLTRSVRSLVIAEWWSYIRESEIKPLTTLSGRHPQPPYNNIPSECRKLCDLTGESELQPSSTEAYSTAIDRLFWLFDRAQVPSTSHFTVRWIIAWPVQLPDEYVKLLNQRRPEALIILAYYGVVLHSYRKVWAIGNSGAALIEAINAQLGNYWGRWLLWPMQIIDCK